MIIASFRGRAVLTVGALATCTALVSAGLGLGATSCTKPGQLNPGGEAAIEALNNATCPLWVPLATSALGAKLGGLGPLAGALTGALTCAGEEAAVDALLAELTAPVDAGAGLGTSVAAMTAAPSSNALKPVTKASGKAVLLVPAAAQASCQAALARTGS